MDKTTKIIVAVVVVAVVALVSYTLIKNNAGPTSSGPIKIGFIGPLTGEASSIGTVNKVAVEIAADEINKAGGVNGQPLQVIYEDGKCDSTTAVNAANKLMNVDNVPIIIGGLCSVETAAFGPSAMEKKVIVFSYGSSAPDLSKLGKYFFRSYPSDAFQGKFGAEYAYNILKARNVAVAYHISDWGTGIKNVFEQRFQELGGKIIDEEGAPQDAKDYRTMLSKIKTFKPDLIYLPMYPDGATIALLQARDLGIKTKFLEGDPGGDPKLQKAVSGKVDIIYTEVVVPQSEDFKAKIKAKTNSDSVPLGSEEAYDNVKIIAQIISQVGLDPDKISDALRSINYSGVSGQISFDQNGDLTTANYVVKKIENGTGVEAK